MNRNKVFTLINEQNNNLAFKLFYFENTSNFDHFAQNNFYTIIWIRNGKGIVKVDDLTHDFFESTLFSFSPYQPFMLSSHTPIEGIAIQFHSDFYCIHKISEETNCEGLVFNNIYQAPFITIDKAMEGKLEVIMKQFDEEIKQTTDKEYKLLLPILIQFLVTIARQKAQMKTQVSKFVVSSDTPAILRSLKKAIEEHYMEKHAASDYATLLHISLNALAKIVKTYFNKTLTNLIAERIVVQAKRELYLTNKTIKAIAWELGYADEYYFSRFCKTHVKISPQRYRETVGFGKAENN